MKQLGFLLLVAMGFYISSMSRMTQDFLQLPSVIQSCDANYYYNAPSFYSKYIIIEFINNASLLQCALPILLYVHAAEIKCP